MCKLIKIPRQLSSDPNSQVNLILKNCSVAEHCTHSREMTGTMYLQEHVIMLVLQGTNKLIYGTEMSFVNAGEMVLLNKNTLVTYNKIPDGDSQFDCIIFSLENELLLPFLGSNKELIQKQTSNALPVKNAVYKMSPRLKSFALSLIPYFYDGEQVFEEQLRIKFSEMLYDIASYSKEFFQEILNLENNFHPDLRHIIDNYYNSAITLKEMSEISGRSLSSFKRDFRHIYNSSPGKYLCEKKLKHAADLLKSSTESITVISINTGFENLAHFSRIFKKQFGKSPSKFRE